MALKSRMGESYYTPDELAEFEWGSIGTDVQIKRNVTIPFTRNVFLGSHIRIDDFVVIVASNADEPVRIGSRVQIANHCHLAGSGGITIGNFCALSPGCMLFSGSDDYTGQKLTNPTVPRHLIGGPEGRITMGDHVILGAGTIVHPKVTIGEGVSVGSLGLVRHDLDAWGMYVGIPARRIRARSKAMLALAEGLEL